MDPVAALRTINSDPESVEAFWALEDLAEWLRNGGFVPMGLNISERAMEVFARIEVDPGRTIDFEDFPGLAVAQSIRVACEYGDISGL